MKKIVRVDYRAEKELLSFSRNVQLEFKSSFRVFEVRGRLNFPEAKKINKDLYEIRINVSGAYRGLYAYMKSNYMIILHLFRKKSQKTPVKNLKLAEKRLKQYE